MRPESVEEISLERYCIESERKSSHTGWRTDEKAQADLNPTSQRAQGRCQEKRSLCVRPYTKSLPSARPLSLSPSVLTDAISTGKKGRQ